MVIENESETIIPNLAKDEPEGHQDQISEQLSGGIDHMVQLPRKPEDEANSADTGMISLSVDDLYQYSVAQTNVDSGGTHENVDIHDKLSEGAAEIVPLGMDEFMAGSDIDTLPYQELIYICNS